MVGNLTFAKRALALGLLGTLALVITACGATTTFTRGNMPTAYQIGQVQPGKTGRAQVTEQLGTPTVKSTVDPNYWFYTSQQFREHPLLGRELLKQNVLVVQFGDFDRVASVRQFEAGIDGIIRPSSNSTNLSMRERTMVEQVVGALFPGSI